MSNLIAEKTSVLREKNKQIEYVYDGLNRLVKIQYPDTEDTVYTYGGSSAKNGAAGRILSLRDASGSLEYAYGALGEVIKETRTLNTHLHKNDKTLTAVMEYRSDYLGRMQNIKYPDGETVTYGYDAGGQVVSVHGKRGGHEFPYVEDIGYDEYGQRVYIAYGNGVKTEYSYDPERRWLSSIATENQWGEQFQNMTYRFDDVGNVLGYTNDCLSGSQGRYSTSQSYSYDGLYQLLAVRGDTVYNPHNSLDPEYRSTYTQTFTFDDAGLGNMMSKISTETVSPQKSIGDDLNYALEYSYDESYAHRLRNVGNRYYQYDSNGNIICEQEGSFDENSDPYIPVVKTEGEDVYSSDYGWGLFKESSKGSPTGEAGYRRVYTWNERNQLISSVDSLYNTAYVYGQDGQRSNKYTDFSETLYFNSMWTHHTDTGNSVYGGQTAKNIYLGETRIVTKLNSGNDPTSQEEYYKQYYYHSDHLGSAQLITDYKGDEYQRIEYTPYGETWVEKTSNTGSEFLPYKFTGKELDPETGLYYYGARYLDPKYSMWISCDPALSYYMAGSSAGGGIYNFVNLNLYHYAGNNPIKYTDPTGMYTLDTEDNAPIIIVEKDDNLWNIVKGQSPNLSDKEIQSRVNDIAKLNNLDDPNFVKPGDKLKAPDSVVPDITDDLMAKMEANASDSAIQNPFTFREKVRNKGDWDYKNQKGTVYESGKYNNYFFNGEIITGDAPGNINYGYVGKAAWWASEKLLFKQAGKAQKAAGTSLPEWDRPPYYGDDPNDHNMIKKGIQLYEKRNK